jgi:hypothetical protein
MYLKKTTEEGEGVRRHGLTGIMCERKKAEQNRTKVRAKRRKPSINQSEKNKQ